MLNAPSTRFADLEGSHHLVSSRRPLQVFRSQLEDFFGYGPEPSNGIPVPESGRSHHKNKAIRRLVWQKKNRAGSSLYLRKAVAPGTGSNSGAAEITWGGKGAIKLSGGV